MLIKTNTQSTFIAVAGLFFSLLCVSAAVRPAHADAPYTILHDFSTSVKNATLPNSGLTPGPNGEFYGTTLEGGSRSDPNNPGSGTLYEITASGSFKILHSFEGTPVSSGGTTINDGEDPFSQPVVGSDGSIYGTTSEGGAYGYGIVYKISPSGVETILYSFADSDSDGSGPEYLIMGNDRRLYGVSSSGSTYGKTTYGNIFSIATDGSDFLVQYTFQSSNLATVGGIPGPIITGIGSDPALYGTTYYGPNKVQGAVYSLTPGTTTGGATVKVLHDFDTNHPEDGILPSGLLAFDGSGNLYGVTSQGGLDGDGTVYKIAADLTETVLYNFGDSGDEQNPEDGLKLYSDGNFYGTTVNGDTLFSISPSGDYQLVHTFGNPDANGTSPDGLPAEDSAGDLIGSLSSGGSVNQGVVYKLATALPAASSIASLTVSPSSIAGGASATGTVTLSNPAPSGGAVVALASSSASANVPSSVTVAAGQTSASFSISTVSVGANATATVSASYSGSSQSATLTVTPAYLKSVALSPTSTQGGSAATTANRVYLHGNAYSNAVVTLTSSNTAVATVPSSVTIKAGSSSNTFMITTKAVTSTQTVTITATYNGASETATLTVTAPPSSGAATLKSVVLSPTSTVGGSSNTTANRVYLTGDASSDTTILLTSSNTAVAQVPHSLIVEQGSSSRSFIIVSSSVTTTQTVTISASSGGVTQTATLTVTP